MNWWPPEESGGLGLSLEESVRIVNALAYGDAGVAFTLFLPVLTTTMVALYGSDDLRARHLDPLVESKGFAATRDDVLRDLLFSRHVVPVSRRA